MSAFVRLSKLDPIPLFAADMVHARPALKAAYLDAFSAQVESNNSLDRYIRQAVKSDATADQKLLARGRAAEIRADRQATVVLLAADDSLQRLGKALLHKPLGPGLAFGPIYNGVPLTRLLRATTNAIRHVSEWDDNKELVFPYAAPATVKNRDLKRALENIAVLQHAFGVGKHERIWSAPAFSMLALLDGKFGTDAPNYHRVESAIFDTAEAIISAVDGAMCTEGRLYSELD